MQARLTFFSVAYPLLKIPVHSSFDYEIHKQKFKVCPPLELQVELNRSVVRIFITGGGTGTSAISKPLNIFN